MRSTRIQHPVCSIASKLAQARFKVHISQRPFTSTAPLSKIYGAPVPHRAVLSVTGSQASTFLNGMTATTVPTVDSDRWQSMGGGSYNVFLSAQGRVMYDIFIYPQHQASSDGQAGYLIEYDPRPIANSPGTEPGAHSLPSLTSYLKRFILRSKVKVKDLANDWDVWAVWSDHHATLTSEPWPPHGWRWGRSGAVEPLWPDGTVSNHGVVSTHLTDGAKRLLDRRAPFMGERILIPKGQKPQVDELVVSDRYTLHRIMKGVPEGRDDIPPLEAFPMDSNMDIMGGVDFRKGCYVGQELTVRTYHTGVIRKRVFPVKLARTDPSSDPSIGSIPPFTNIRAVPLLPPTPNSPPRVRPRGTGKMLSSIGEYGLALLRLEHFEAIEKGTMALEAETVNENASTKWSIKPWRPDWWPRPQEEE